MRLPTLSQQPYWRQYHDERLGGERISRGHCTHNSWGTFSVAVPPHPNRQSKLGVILSAGKMNAKGSMEPLHPCFPYPDFSCPRKYSNLVSLRLDPVRNTKELTKCGSYLAGARGVYVVHFEAIVTNVNGEDCACNS